MTTEQLTIGRNLLRSIEETNDLIEILKGATSIKKCKIYLDDKRYIDDLGMYEKERINFKDLKDYALSCLEKQLNTLNEQFKKL